MNASFYLFDVDHGQSAALELPNGRWCIFDVGCTSTFSPVRWIVANNLTTLLAQVLGGSTGFRFLKGTISHLHGDHLADYVNLLQHGPEFLKTVDPDQEYLNDCYATCADASSRVKVQAFLQRYRNGFSPALSTPDYGGVQISELCLPVAVARQVGGDANARVNNASVVTRIDVYGNSLLLCGDMEKEAWEAIIKDNGDYGRTWRPLLSNIDILVAPHHGHRSGYSTDLLSLARPAVVLVSVISRDPNVDSRYSQLPVRGMTIGPTTYHYISTRQKGHIKVEIRPPDILAGQSKGSMYWIFGDAAIGRNPSF
jgi:hypothetical protein